MPITTAIPRIFIALILSIPLFFSLSYYLGARAAQDTLLDGEVITNSFEKSEVYHRVHRDVFLRQEFSGWTSSLVGGFQVSGDTKVQLLKGVVPPSYIETETERNIFEMLGYLKGEDDELNVFINLDPPLENTKPAVFAFLDQQIGTLDPVPVSHPQGLSEEIASFLATVGQGQIPAHVPTGQALDPAQLAQAYRQATDILEQRGSISPNALAHLKRQEPAIMAAIQKRGLREGLKLASHAVAEPRIDEAVASIRQHSDQQDRLDLVKKLAEDSNRTPTQVLRDAGILRSIVQAGTGTTARWTALGITVLCALAMAALFVPYSKHVIFWPSATIFVSGLLLTLLVFSITLDLTLWPSAICTRPDSDFCKLTLDVARTIATDNMSTFVYTSLFIATIGAIGIVFSFIISRTSERKSS